MLRLCHLLGHTKNHKKLKNACDPRGGFTFSRGWGEQINAKTSGRKEDPCQGIPVGIVDRRVAILSLRLEGDFIKFSAQEML